MNPWLNQCHFGDVRDVLRRMIADGVKVNTIVTSPPYWGLRDYGCAGQIGLEPTIQEFIATMTEVFALAREVLADDGTAWVNMGDCYANDGKWGGSTGGKHVASLYGNTGIGRGKTFTGLKPKNLVGQPWRLAFALQDAGWYLRQDIIWAKPNPMPESVTDRCTKSHEYIFLLSKSERYYYDQEAILEPVSMGTHARLSQDVQNQIGSTRANGGAKSSGNMKAVGLAPGNVNAPKGQRKYEAGDVRHRTKGGLLAYAQKARGVGWGHGTDAEARERGRVTRKVADGTDATENNASFDAATAIMPTMRNKRSVWTVATESYKGAHFATFPTKLIEPCILAGCPAGGVVLDPFFGSGTTGQVAQALGRNYIGIELNPDYATLQAERLRQPSLLLEAA